MQSTQSQRPRRFALRAAAVTACLAVVALADPRGQTAFRSGQDVTPAFDGWEKNPDGTFNLAFGYFNRNWDEELDIPVGPENAVEPGGPDQGQPTHFYPRRNRYVFRIKVPKDFGTREISWTLTIRSKTHRAFGTLKPEYITDDQLQQFDIGDFGHNNAKLRGNKRPTVDIEGASTRTVKVGEPLALTAVASDDGLPPPIPAPIRLVGRHGAWGLRVVWFVYRGLGRDVVFEPDQHKSYPDYRANSNSPWTPAWMPPPVPPDGKYPVKVAFKAPGTYVIRVQAHDGGLDDTKNVTVTVVP